MLSIHCTLLISCLGLLAAYPIETPDKLKAKRAAEPVNYPDLTNGLSDAEVESTLNGLSLEDLNALNKLLDDANNGPMEAIASFSGRHRQGKQQHHQAKLDMVAIEEKSPYDDGCHDEDEPEKEPCQKKPDCPTTKRCTGTTPSTCSTKSCGYKSYMDSDSPSYGGKRKKQRKQHPENECDADDPLCLQRYQLKQAQKFNNLQDYNDPLDEQIKLDGLEQLADEIKRAELPPMDKELDAWNGKDEPSAPDVYHTDDKKLSAQHMEDNSAQLNEYKDFKELPKRDHNHKMYDDDSQLVSHRQQAQLKPAAQERLDESNERSYNEREPELVRQKKEEHKLSRQLEELEETLPLNAAATAAPLQGAANDERESEPQPLAYNNNNEGDSFIASNVRDPPRYFIQTPEGSISSINQQGLSRLRLDKAQSELLNQLSSEEQQQQLQRYKRGSHKTDDAPANTDESYMKKLMDSFPRDQGSQSEMNIALRLADSTHLRFKRC
ncbi:CG31805 [Drosophila busckii]|uniref:CG31805 n=1 Tax=Drosophila busckii TaxID=30019 RepID=A0A0M4EDS9_DROBS|nr:uncharacterized protein LOC108606165 [Drosophila busckii]ALC40060.1 CG31805 [Drosophila busckii]